MRYIEALDHTGIKLAPRPLRVVCHNHAHVIEALANRLPDFTFVRPVPHTTRPPRDGEIHSEDYYFTTKDEMMTAIEEKCFIEAGKYKVLLSTCASLSAY